MDNSKKKKLNAAGLRKILNPDKYFEVTQKNLVISVHEPTLSYHPSCHKYDMAVKHSKEPLPVDESFNPPPKKFLFERNLYFLLQKP